MKYDGKVSSALHLFPSDRDAASIGASSARLPSMILDDTNLTSDEQGNNNVSQPHEDQLPMQQQGGDKFQSLLEILNVCKTSMGSRLMRKWLQSPLCVHQSIIDRQTSVEAFFSAAGLRCSLRDSKDALLAFPDFEKYGKG